MKSLLELLAAGGSQSETNGTLDYTLPTGDEAGLNRTVSPESAEKIKGGDDSWKKFYSGLMEGEGGGPGAQYSQPIPTGAKDMSQPEQMNPMNQLLQIRSLLGDGRREGPQQGPAQNNPYIQSLLGG